MGRGERGKAAGAAEAVDSLNWSADTERMISDASAVCGRRGRLLGVCGGLVPDELDVEDSDGLKSGDEGEIGPFSE